MPRGAKKPAPAKQAGKAPKTGDLLVVVPTLGKRIIGDPIAGRIRQVRQTTLTASVIDDQGSLGRIKLPRAGLKRTRDGIWRGKFQVKIS